MAVKLLATAGFAGLTTRKLAESANTRETILYRCYSSKDAIVKDCLRLAKDNQLREWEEIQNIEKDPSKVLKQLMSLFVSRPSQDSMNFLMLTRLNAEPLPSELRTEVKDVYAAWHQWLSHLVKLVLNSKGKRVDNAAQKALALLHWGVGLGNLQLAELPQSLDPKESSYQMHLAYRMVEEL